MNDVEMAEGAAVNDEEEAPTPQADAGTSRKLTVTFKKPSADALAAAAAEEAEAEDEEDEEEEDDDDDMDDKPLTGWLAQAGGAHDDDDDDDAEGAEGAAAAPGKDRAPKKLPSLARPVHASRKGNGDEAKAETRVGDLYLSNLLPE